MRKFILLMSVSALIVWFLNSLEKSSEIFPAISGGTHDYDIRGSDESVISICAREQFEYKSILAVEHRTSLRYGLFLLLDSGDAVATDPSSSTGYRYWKLSDSDFELVKKGIMKCSGLGVAKQANSSLPEVPCTLVRIRNGRTIQQLYKVDQSMWDLNEGSLQRALEEVPIKNIARQINSVHRSNAAEWPQNPNIEVTLVCRQIEPVDKANVSSVVEEYLYRRAQPRVMVSRGNVPIAVYEEVLRLTRGRSPVLLGTHYFALKCH